MSNTNPVWTIQPSGLTGPGNRSYLIGCHITTNSANPPTGYVFTLPNITQILGTSPGTTLPTSGFTFSTFDWNGNTFTIEVGTLGASGAPWSGKWSTTPIQGKGKPTGTPGDEDGTWTAQAGTGADDRKTKVKTKSKTAKSTGA
jgi:hypothetical protein